jgi:hypothetical protein
MKANVDTFVELLSTIAGALRLLPILLFQVITIPATEEMQQNKGNALGLDASEGPIYIVNFALEWGDPADDERGTTGVLLKHENGTCFLSG